MLKNIYIYLFKRKIEIKRKPSLLYCSMFEAYFNYVERCAGVVLI